MTGFFARMAARPTGSGVAVRLRAPQRYEIADGRPGVAAERREAAVTDRRSTRLTPPPPERPEPPDAPLPRAADPTGTPASTDAQASQPHRTPVPPVAPTGLDPASTGPGTDPPPVESVLRSPPRDEAPATAALTGEEPVEPTQPGGTSRAPCRPAETPQTTPDARTALESSRADGQGHRGAAALPDVEVLVREHLLPVLVERGHLSDQERPRPVSPPGRRRRAATAPPAGQVDVTTGRVAVRRTPTASVAGDPSQPAATPQVHVHIDRVVVTRSPARQPDRTAPATAPPRVDHADYLARRRQAR